MKKNPLLNKLGRQALLLGCVCLVCQSTTAQNYVKNGDFAQPLGPTNWTFGYLHGGPDDFDIKDRTSRQGTGFMFRPVGTIRVAHAYLGQTVTNLDTNTVYTVSGYMREDWWRDRDPNDGIYHPDGDGQRNQFLVYIEAIGSLGNPMPDGRSVVLATNQTPPTGPPAGSNDCLIYAVGTYSQYLTHQKPDSNGNIEVRLHYFKNGQVNYDKNWIMCGMFKNIALTP